MGGANLGEARVKQILRLPSPSRCFWTTQITVETVAVIFVMVSAAMSSEEIIKELCARVVTAEGPDLQRAVGDLHAALKTHIKSLRMMAAAALVQPKIPPTDLPQG